MKIKRWRNAMSYVYVESVHMRTYYEYYYTGSNKVQNIMHFENKFYGKLRNRTQCVDDVDEDREQS